MKLMLYVFCVYLIGGHMNDPGDATDKVKAGTDAHRAWAFGHVTEWASSGGTASIRMSDGSKWTLAGEDRISKYRALLDLSRSDKKPILLAVDENTHDVGMIFSTMKGVPSFNGETADGKQLRVSVPPSMRVFRLQKSRPWFDRVKTAISNAQKPADPGSSPGLWIAFDSLTSEIVDVRPTSD